MLLCIIALATLLIGVILLIVYHLMDAFSPYDVDWLGTLATVCVAAGLMFGLIFSGGVLVTYINTDIDFENAQHERDVLMYRLEHDDNVVTGNGSLYDEVVAFNNGLRRKKIRGSSLWTNWFYNQRIINELDYIDITDFGGN